MSAEEQGTDTVGWAIVELMGHRRLAGYVSEQTLAGAAFLRIDVPTEPRATQLYSPGAVYCITPVAEDLARQVAGLSRVEPVGRWELPAPRSPIDDVELEDGGEPTGEWD